jgi:hypothetical protein
MPKPSSVLSWNPPDGPTTVVEPSSLKKLLGWLSGERPPAQFFNWFWKKTSEWVDYLDGLTSEELEWLAFHLFQDGVTFERAIDVGSSLIASVGEALSARIAIYLAPSSVAGHTRVFRFIPLEAGTISEINVYVRNISDTQLNIRIAHNAELNSLGQWVRKVAGQHAMLVEWTQGGDFKVYRHSSADGSPWTDAFTAGNWDGLVITANTGAMTVAALAAQLGLFTNVIATGDVEAATGLNRGEHLSFYAGYTGGSGDTQMELCNAGMTAVDKRLYRPGAGKVITLVAWVQTAPAIDLTFKVWKDSASISATVIGSLTLEAGNLFAKATLAGATYSADDYLYVTVTSGGTTFAANDQAAMIRTRE